MADWADISRNAKKHGDFAGRTRSEQEAYFEFFAGSKNSQHQAIRLKLSVIFARINRVYHNRGLSSPVARVASTDPATSK